MKDQIHSLVWVIALATLLMGCETRVTKVESGGVPTDKYNELVKKYNGLLDGAYEASEASRKAAKQLAGLSSTLTLFSRSAEAYLSDAQPSRAQLTKVVANYEAGLTQLAETETLVLQEMVAMDANANRVYQAGLRDAFKSLLDTSSWLVGVNAEHRLLMKAVERHSQNSKLPPETNESGAPVASPQARITLAPAEREISRVTSGGGIYRDASGNLAASSPAEFSKFAAERGFPDTIANDSFRMASRNNGVVGLACSNKDLIVVLNDLISHMKAKMNQNSDDLELAFAIDYSGSMNNNIQYVLTRIVDFAKNLENIKASGRNVKVAIATFGEPGKEKVELPFTSDLAVFRDRLKLLLDLYQQNHHSTDPGEAIYAGLDLVIRELPFTSQNRQIVAITDEPSWELQTGKTSTVNDVEARMKRFSLYPLIVRYCD